MSWYQQVYVNRRDWILSHLDALNLSSDEVLIVLYIDLCNSNRQSIDGNSLAAILNMSQDNLDKAIANLINTKRLVLEYPNGTVHYNIDGLFTYENPTLQVESSPLITIIEQQFGRKLTVNELRKLAQMRDLFGDELIEQALREALFNRKYSLDYVNAICVNWKKV